MFDTKNLKIFNQNNSSSELININISGQ